MNEFKMDAPEQEPDWSVRMREVHSDQLKRVRAEARALIEQMRDKCANAIDDLQMMKDADFPPEDFHRIYDWHHEPLTKQYLAAIEWLKANP